MCDRTQALILPAAGKQTNVQLHASAAVKGPHAVMTSFAELGKKTMVASDEEAGAGERQFARAASLVAKVQKTATKSRRCEA